MRSKRFLFDNSRPLRVLIWRIALDKGSLNLARLSSAVYQRSKRTYNGVISGMECRIHFDKSHHPFSTSSELDDCPFTPLHPIQRAALCVFPTFILTPSSLPSVRHIKSPSGKDQILRRRKVGIGTCDNGSRLEGGAEVDGRYLWAWKSGVWFRRWNLSICSEPRLSSAHT